MDANLAPQIRKDLEAAGLTVNVQSMASGDLYVNLADVDNPTFDVALAPGDPRSSVSTPASSSTGGTVTTWTQKRGAWGKTNPEGFKKLEIVSRS